MKRIRVVVNDLMQRGYECFWTEPIKVTECTDDAN
jgi:hypothetical protein